MSFLRRAAFRLLSTSAHTHVPFARPVASFASNKIVQLPIRTSQLIPQRRWLADDATATSPAPDPVEISSSESASSPEADSTPASSLPDEESQPVESHGDSITDNLATASEAAVASNAAESAAPSKYASNEEYEAIARKTIYVGNVFFDTTQEDLEERFGSVGKITKCRLVQDYRGMSRGFAYIYFEDQKSVANAIQQFNSQPFQGRRLTVQPAHADSLQRAARRQGGSVKSSKTVYIGNLSFDVSDRELNDLFNELGSTEVRLAIDRRTGQPRGFAHADFASEELAGKALEHLRGRDLLGRRLRADFAASSTNVHLKNAASHVKTDDPIMETKPVEAAKEASE